MIYDKKDTVYFKLNHQIYTYATDTWALSNPDTGFPKITILDPSGATKVTAAAMTEKATGKFEYLYTLILTATAGWWTGYIEVENSGYSDRVEFGFEVK